MTPMKSVRYARQMRHRLISLLLIVVILLSVTITASGDRPEGDMVGPAEGLVVSEQEMVPEASLDVVPDPVVSEIEETEAPPELPETPAVPDIAPAPPVEGEQESVATDEEETYTVKAGDCLWKIAEKAYGNGADWTKIYDANSNQISNPNLIYPGQVFVIPAI